ncbi:MAG: Ni/Fe hydrogenase subunit alpha, partial [Thermoproteota archaeon]
AYEDFMETLGRPAHATLASHWARLIEMIYCSERMLELLEDPEILSKEVMNYEGDYRGEGVAAVEAPRGTLIHHYKADENGIIKGCNMVVPTTMNNAAICMEIKKSASKLIKNGNVPESVLNRIEMAFRAYDPCLSCSTHSLPGEMPLEVVVMTEDGRVLRRLRRV